MKIVEDIQKNIEDFKIDTLKLDKFLTGTRVAYHFFENKYPEINNEFNKKVRNKNEMEEMRLFENLYASISIYDKEIFKYCFINIIARTEAFLNDIARSIYLWKKPDLTKEIREKAISNYSHFPFRKKLEHLNNEFGLSFPEIEEKKDTISEFFSRRNIILHNNCLVNETYLKINNDSNLKIGDEVVVGEDYLKLTFIVVIIIAKTIEKQIKLIDANAIVAKS